jgi:hypothetical protein
MDKTPIIIGFLIFFIGLILLNRRKNSLADDALLTYEKSVRPQFIIYYWLSTTPMLFIVFCLLSENYDALLKYFIVFILVSLALDLLTLLKLYSAVKTSRHSKELSTFPLYIVLVLIGKTLLLLGLKITMTP